LVLGGKRKSAAKAADGESGGAFASVLSQMAALTLLDIACAAAAPLTMPWRKESRPSLCHACARGSRCL
jgi:hypothetical protein